jgi:spermidine/putrescine transport system permease protein
MDLGASPTRTFLRVTLPLIFPGIVAAAMLSFALSLDDFIITLFTAGSKLTYPLFVNNAAKTSLPPQINVLATMILLASLFLIGLSAFWQRWKTRGEPV